MNLLTVSPGVYLLSRKLQCGYHRIYVNPFCIERRDEVDIETIDF